MAEPTDPLERLARIAEILRRAGHGSILSRGLTREETLEILRLADQQAIISGSGGTGGGVGSVRLECFDPIPVSEMPETLTITTPGGRR